MEIKFTLDRFEGEKAVLRAEDGTLVAWPKSKLDNPHEGMVVIFQIKEAGEKEKENKSLAKKILNEILNINN